MSREKLIYPFVFEEANRSKLTFSDSTKIRLNPEANRIELKRQSYDLVTGLPVYPITTVHWVKTWVANPEALISWISFYCDPIDSDLPDDTAIQFKLNDGTNDYFWNSSLPTPAWAIAGANNWNTHAEITAHISTFTITSCRLAIIIGLSTADANETPWVNYLDVLMSVELENLYSIIAGSVVPEFREQLLAPVDFAIEASGNTKISLCDIETPFNISSVTAAYNHTSDPKHRTNILSAYDSAAKSITLTTAVERGNSIWLMFNAEPEVTINWGNQDYIEVEKIPAVIIDAIKISTYGNIASQETKNIVANTAIVRRRPLRLTIDFEVLLLAERTRTLLAMMEKAMKFSASHPVVRWRDIDQEISFKSKGPSFAQRPNLSDKHEATMSVTLENIYLWVIPEETIPLVQRLNLSMTNSRQNGPLWND
jgi:hypothetical protein